MRHIFIVIKRGIYIQDLFGFFSDRGSAMIAAKTSIQQEPDDHHGFHIYKLPFDQHLSEGIDEIDPIHILIREGNEVLIDP